MSHYAPKLVPPNSTDLPAFLQQELQSIAQAIAQEDEFITLSMRYTAPQKPRTGMVVLADGVSWNPGSGAGFYGYYGSAWVKLG